MKCCNYLPKFANFVESSDSYKSTKKGDIIRLAIPVLVIIRDTTSTTTNALAGNLVKAQCDFCGRKFGSLEEARKCETNHLEDAIRNPLKEELIKSIERSK